MPVERAPRAAKKKAAEALHELVQNDEELVRIIKHGDSHLTQDPQQTSQSRPQLRVIGTDGDGSERTRHRHASTDSDSDEGDNWKPTTKKRRKTPELDDNQRKRPHSVNRQSENKSGHENDRRSDKQSSSKGDSRERSKSAKTKRPIAPDDLVNHEEVVEQKTKRKKRKLRRVPAGKDVDVLDSDGDNLDSDYSESENNDDEDDDDDDDNINGTNEAEDEEVDGISLPGKVKSENEDSDVGEGQPMWSKSSNSFGPNFGGNRDKPLTSMVHTLMSQEQKAMSALSLMALDPRKKDENYRWPVREGFLPS